MAKQLSSAASNFLEAQGSWGEMFNNFLLMFYTGSQPANGDAAATGTACVLFSKGAGEVTKETIAEWKFSITAGAAGTIDTVKVGLLNILPAPVGYATSLANTAALVATAINSKRNVSGLTARESGADVYITAPKNCGATMNSMVLTGTATTMTVSVAGDGTPAGSGGTAGIAAINCLSLVYPAVNGVCAKESAVWQGVGGSGSVGFTNSFLSGTVTAGWFRAYASMDDPELTGTPVADTGKQYLRYDGTIGVDLTSTGGTTIAFGATQTQDTFTHYTPTNQG
jgi:hypothetical protein